MRILVFDTETTGLPQMTADRQYYEPKDHSKYDSARIIEIAYIILDQTYNQSENRVKYLPLVTYRSLVKFEGVNIQNSNIHGITTGMVLEGGVDTQEMLSELQKDISTHKVDRLVAHNITFDINVLLSECFRYQREDLAQNLQTMEPVCTMYYGKIYMDYMKRPKLSELYEFIFHRSFANAHSALSDTKACLECYQMLTRKRVIHSH